MRGAVVVVVVAVVAIGSNSSICISSRSSADYAVKNYGFVRIADCARISGGYGLQDYGSF